MGKSDLLKEGLKGGLNGLLTEGGEEGNRNSC